MLLSPRRGGVADRIPLGPFRTEPTEGAPSHQPWGGHDPSGHPGADRSTERGRRPASFGTAPCIADGQQVVNVIVPPKPLSAAARLGLELRGDLHLGFSLNREYLVLDNADPACGRSHDACRTPAESKFLNLLPIHIVHKLPPMHYPENSPRFGSFHVLQ